MAKTVTVYTRTTCAYCAQVKRYLDMKHQSYDVINLDEQPTAADEIIQKSGARTVPVVVVRDDASGKEDIAIGWNPGKLAAALAT